MAEASERRWGRILSAIITAALLLVYCASYLILRSDHTLIHRKTWGGGKNYHSVELGDPGIALGWQIMMMEAASPGSGTAFARRLQRRWNVLLALFAPARYAESLYWERVDP